MHFFFLLLLCFVNVSSCQAHWFKLAAYALLCLLAFALKWNAQLKTIKLSRPRSVALQTQTVCSWENEGWAQRSRRRHRRHRSASLLSNAHAYRRRRRGFIYLVQHFPSSPLQARWASSPGRRRRMFSGCFLWVCLSVQQQQEEEEQRWRIWRPAWVLR